MGTDRDLDAHQKSHRKLDWMGSMRISHIRWTPDGVCMRADDGAGWAGSAHPIPSRIPSKARPSPSKRRLDGHSGGRDE